MTWIDWGIVAAVFAFLMGVVIVSKSLMRSVSDYLAAGRTTRSIASGAAQPTR